MLSPRPPAVSFRNLSVRYGSVAALVDASATAVAGTLVCLVGLNGSGKSTLLKALVGTVPASGEVSIMGTSGPARRRQIAYVPQREAVEWDFPISVLEVVMLGRRTHLARIGWARSSDRVDAMGALERLGLGDMSNRSIAALSGGQQQRVMLARAIHSAAPVMLLDEPLNGVDPGTRRLVLELLREHCTAGGTVLMATHDVVDSAEIADRIWGINRSVVADLEPHELLEEPALRKIYGDSLLVLGGGRLALGDQTR